MKSTLSRSAVVVALFLAVLASGSAIVVPHDVATAEKSLGVWINGLEGKSESEVVKLLGPPAERSTWDFRGAKRPVLHFRTPGGAKLGVYFAGDGQAVNVSYHLMSQ
jgi:hypothetical protein